MKPTAVKILALGAAFAALAVSAHAQPAYKVTDHIAIPDGGWDYAAVDAAARRLYVARGTTVTAVDLDSGKVTAELTPAARGHAAVPLPGGRLLVTNGTTDTAVIVDGASGKVSGFAEVQKTTAFQLAQVKDSLQAAGISFTVLD